MTALEANEHCPMCGQALPPRDNSDPDALLRLLKMPGEGRATGPQPRDVYKAAEGRWRVTFGGGEWPERTVLELMARGEIHPVLNDPSLNVYNAIQKLYAIS